MLLEWIKVFFIVLLETAHLSSLQHSISPQILKQKQNCTVSVNRRWSAETKGGSLKHKHTNGLSIWVVVLTASLWFLSQAAQWQAHKQDEGSHAVWRRTHSRLHNHATMLPLQSAHFLINKLATLPFCIHCQDFHVFFLSQMFISCHLLFLPQFVLL